MDRWRQHRRVDELVQAMEMSGILKSSVSKPCEDIDERVNAFLNCYPKSRAICVPGSAIGLGRKWENIDDMGGSALPFDRASNTSRTTAYFGLGADKNGQIRA